MGNVIARQRLFLNADKTKLVGEGDTEGAFLYVAPGDEIPEDAHDLFGLEDGALPDFKPADPGEVADKVPNVAPPPGPKEKAARRAANIEANAKAREQAKVGTQAKADKGASTTKEAGPGKNKEAAPGADKSDGKSADGTGGDAGGAPGEGGQA
jgi:hypothetical protein